MKKFVPLIFCLFCFAFASAQTTYDFSSGSTISGGAGGFGIWNTQADITIGGVAYRITSGGNGSLTNQATGGSSNSKCLRKDGSGGDQFTLSRVDGQPFQFYGIWIKHQSMNSYTEFMSLPPFYSITYNTPDEEDIDPTYLDNTPLQGGSLTTSSTTITKNITVTSVQINFNAIIYYWIDDIIVGPAAGAAPTISGQPSNATVCSGSNTSFSVTASNTTDYQWQVNTGTGFSNISNSSVYSGATTATLSITGATSALNGYTYRCVANGSGSVNSNSATLTVKTIVSGFMQTNIACNGSSTGAITVSPSGGTTPYTYNWTPGNPTGDGTNSVTGLTAGSWTVNITDNAGCTLVKNFTLTQPAALSATTSKTDVSCNGGSNGSASVSVSGGTPPYMYSWSPRGGTAATASGLTVGTYYCTITDMNDCSIVKTITVVQPAPALPSFSVQPQNQTANSSGSASFTVTAINATGYQWQVNAGSGFTNISNTGNYSGATTASLNISEATASMNGYLYRCIITATCGAPVTSTSAQLTTKSNDAFLSAIQLGNGTLSPEFSSESFLYNAEVSSGTASVDITPVTSDNKATVTVNGSPLTEGASTIALEGGSNTILIVVTAEDGVTSHEYSLKIFRPFVSVTSITRTGGQYTNASTCSFTLKFSGAVNNLGMENISVAASTTLSGYSIQSISQTASDTYNVTVNTGEGDGTIGLNVNNGGGLSAPLNGLPYTETELYTIDKTIPEAIARNITITLGADGKATASAQNINDGSTDNVTDAELLEYNISKTTFTGSDLGENYISFTVTDQAGNSKVIQAKVTVVRAINSVATQESVSIVYGSNLSLPETVQVTYSDLHTENISATWDTSAYNGRRGEYQFTGTLNAPDNTVNTEELKAHITLEVTRRPLHVQLAGTSEKTYDGNITATLGQNNYLSDKLEKDQITFTAGAVYDNKNAGTEKNIQASDISISGEDADNYTLSNETADANIGIIDQRSLNVTISGPVEKIYDGKKTATLTAVNFHSDALENDDIYFNAYAEYDNKNAGEGKTVTASDFFVSGEDANNYSLITEIAQTTGTISRLEISAYTNAEPLITKVYDATIAAAPAGNNYGLNGTIDGDDLQVSGNAVYDNKNVGDEKVITINELQLSGASKNNYMLTTESLQTTGKITAKSVAAGLKETLIAKTYDGNTVANINENNLYIEGVIGEDHVNLTIPSTGTYDDKHAGSGKKVTVSGLNITGEDANNYILESSSVDALVGKISPKEISVTADVQTKVYGSNDPQFTYHVNSLIEGDHLSGNLSREQGKNVGTYAIHQGTVTGGNDYTITDFIVDSLTITPAALTIKAEDKSRLQGAVNPLLTLSYSGLVAGDAPSDLSEIPVISTDATSKSPIGYYSIIVKGAASKNYNITYVEGKLTVLPPGNVEGSVKAWSSAPGTIDVRVYAETEQDATITLFTEIGQPIVIHQRHLNAGINRFTLPTHKLASSTYVLSVWAKKFKQGQRVPVK